MPAAMGHTPSLKFHFKSINQKTVGDKKNVFHKFLKSVISALELSSRLQYYPVPFSLLNHELN